MKYLNNWNQINEADKSSKEGSKRSERLLTQAQKVSVDSQEVKEKSGPMPAMVFTDVVGSSKMWSDDPITMATQLERHHKLVESIAEKNKGWIVKTIGDAFMVYFESSKDSLFNAVNFAKQVILGENAYNLRVGVCQGHMDEKIYRIQKVDLKDFFGNAVNTASRMESKVSEVGGTIAFCSTEPIENKLGKIKTLGAITEVDLSKYDLRGAKVEKAYKVKVK
ncbi:MAG: adenylate/guanylate cyclase domain-containing protein [Verrucomicrobia bacterium]|nr:adenylate/guanylate cyclase domain-containing protein [Verrucomicrobiota bacterium]